MDITVDGLAWFTLSEIGEKRANWLRRKLTIADAPGRRATLMRCYREDAENDLFGVPRGFFFDGAMKDHSIKEEVSFGDQWPDRTSRELEQGEQGDDEKELTLRADFDDESRRGYQAALSHFGSRNVAEGILCFPALSDARMVVLALVRALRLRTLILVSDEVEAEFWLAKIYQILPDASSGFSPSDHIGVSTVDDMRKLMKLGEHHAASFGMLVAANLDEVDPVRWAAVVSRIPAAKRVGVASDTLNLSGLRKAISYHIGARVFTGRREQLVPKIRRVWSQWRVGGFSRVNPLFISKDNVVSSMMTSTVYNQHVVEQVILAAKADRAVVVFSEHLSHLRLLRKEIEAKWVGEITVDYLIDGMGRLDVADALQARVVLAMYSKARTLPEMPNTDTVVLATPIRDPSYAIGCALMPQKGKKEPVVVDMRCDNIPVCKEYASVRDGIYSKLYGEKRA